MLSELVAEYDFKKTVTAPKEDLLGIEQQMPTKGIINLDSMAQLVDTVNKSRITKLSNRKRSAIYIKDKELQFVDELLDDRLLNRLLANEGHSPAKRDLFPNNFFRAELLKAIKFPEIRYRKFCTEAYLGLGCCIVHPTIVDAAKAKTIPRYEFSRQFRLGTVINTDMTIDIKRAVSDIILGVDFPRKDLFNLPEPLLGRLVIDSKWL